jgi:hypothetical protein
VSYPQATASRPGEHDARRARLEVRYAPVRAIFEERRPGLLARSAYLAWLSTQDDKDATAELSWWDSHFSLDVG